MKHSKITIIGLGLIGGSLARTIRRKYVDTIIYALDSDHATLNAALSDKTIDQGFSDLDPLLYESDIIFLCAPVDVNISLLKKLSQNLPFDAGCLISDVSSIKTEIHAAVDSLGLSNRFIGGHPMAGTEQTGFSHADAYLFENVYYILTPSEAVNEEKITFLSSFLTGLDIIPIRLSVKEHDFATAAVSHVPHIISAALVNLVKDRDSEDQVLKAIAAGGFKDITRISSSSPDMWTMISRGNKEQILPVLEQYIDSLSKIHHEISSGQETQIHDFFESAKDYRDTIENRNGGALTPSYQLTCDIIDEEGEIASIATRLAAHHISIKNIGIVHSREFEQGVLCVEFYTEQALEEAHALLEKCNYKIYDKA